MIPPDDSWFSRIRQTHPTVNGAPELIESLDDRTWALAVRAVMDESMPHIDGHVVGYPTAPAHLQQRLKEEWHAWSAKTGEPLPWAPSARHRGAFTKPENPLYWRQSALDHIARHSGVAR